MDSNIDKMLVCFKKAVFLEEDNEKEIQREIDRLTYEKDKLTNFDRQLSKEIEKKISELTSMLLNSEERLMLNHGHDTVIDLEVDNPMSWRHKTGNLNKKGLPVFAIFNVNSRYPRRFCLSGREKQGMPMLEVSPPLVGYEDLEGRLSCNRIEARLTGELPKTVRDRINEINNSEIVKYQKMNICAFFDIEKWIIREIVDVSGRGILAGYISDRLWFIDQFETIFLEQAMEELGM